jgi:hypothetical protein
LYLLTTQLSVGTPPQDFNVIASLYARYLFVVSSHLNKTEFKDYNHYNSSLSSTYVANNTSVFTQFLNAEAIGFTSQDSIKLGEMTVTNNAFTEAVDLGNSDRFRAA